MTSPLAEPTLGDSRRLTYSFARSLKNTGRSVVGGSAGTW